MIDRYGRKIDYLRVSVTQRCNLKCVYCGAESPDLNELTPDEIFKIVSAFARCGITKVRLTGGEPLMRNDIAEIAAKISGIPGIQKIVLTTNGVKLSENAERLKEAGVSAVNISLDSLDRENYKKITGIDCLDKVMKGMEAAEKAGLKVRVNSVLLRGQNDSEAEALLNLARRRKIDVRFIELMPFSGAGKNEKLIVTGDELIQKFDFLHPVETKKDFEKSVARYYEADGFLGKIGFITPISENFCDSCNRIRLLSNGSVRPCLGYDTSYDLMQYINDEEKLTEAIKDIVSSKPKGHKFSCGYGNSHAMNKIGG